MKKSRLMVAGIIGLLTATTMQAQNASNNQNMIPISGTENTAFGNGALNNSNTGGRNTAVGQSALNLLTTGDFNTAVGDSALYNNTTGYENVAHGAFALITNKTGSKNTAIGTSALFNNLNSGNTAVGFNALGANTTGFGNGAEGYLSLNANTTGSYNIAVGYQSLLANTTGNRNTAIGYQSNVSSNNLSNATAIGSNATVTASNAMQLGDGNVTQIYAGIGTAATFNTGGIKITGGSPGAGKVLTSDAVGVGTWQSLSSGWLLSGNAGTTDSTNYIGTSDYVPLTLKVNGKVSGRIDPSGVNSCFFGFKAGNATTGSYNTAVGNYALYSNTTGDFNAALGLGALYVNTVGTKNAAGGYGGLGSNTTGSLNAAFGYASLISNTIGTMNTAIGANADVNAGNLVNATALGAGALVLNSNNVLLGNTTCTIITGNPAVYTGSDARFKTAISETDVIGLEFIKRLRPVMYNFDTKKQTEFITRNMPDSVRKKYLNEDFGPSTAIRQTGFIAQEVEKAAQETGFNFHGVHKPGSDNDYYSLAYSTFVVPLVKAVQEQQAMIENLKQEVESLKNQKTATEINKSSTGFKQVIDALDDGNNIGQNIPNPFSHETTIKYTLPAQTSNAYMAVFDLSGKQIATFNLTEKGNASISITSEKLAAGMYIYSIIADGKLIGSKRMIVAEK